MHVQHPRIYASLCMKDLLNPKENITTGREPWFPQSTFASGCISGQRSERSGGLSASMDAVSMEEQMQSMQIMMQQLFKMNHFHNDHAVVIGLHDAAAEGAIMIPPLPSDTGSGGTETSHSPCSWETTMYSLAKELETICSRGSSPRDSPNTSPCVTPTNGTAPELLSRRPVSLASGPLTHQGSLCEGGCGSCNAPSGARQVRVRHEETEDRLDRGLTMICRQNSPQVTRFFCGEATDEPNLMDKKRRGSKLNYRDSAKYGIRFRLDLAGRDPDNITLSINVEEHILRVFDDGELIHLLQLAENTDPQTLSCTILDGNTLFVKQRTKEAVCLENEGSSEVNLPISRQEESTLTTTISLRIPSDVSADDVTVKTIDDTLMIRAGGSTNDTGGPGAHKFWVAMNLPEGTDTRSVCAWMTKGRLTVKGRLAPTSRRMTCSF